MSGSELLTSTFADTIALHGRVKNGETQVGLDAAAELVGRFEPVPSSSSVRGQELPRTLLHVIGDLVERAFVA